MARPLRWPTVNAWAPAWVPSSRPSGSTMGPGARSMRSASQPRVSPSGMKQMSWESGFAATDRPRSAASARTSSLDGVSASGKRQWAS